MSLVLESQGIKSNLKRLFRKHHKYGNFKFGGDGTVFVTWLINDKLNYLLVNYFLKSSVIIQSFFKYKFMKIRKSKHYNPELFVF